MSAPEASSLTPEIRRILRDELAVAVPADDVNLLDEGLLDSLGLVRLFARLEERFAVEIDLDAVELRDVETVQGLAALVARSRGSVA